MENNPTETKSETENSTPETSLKTEAVSGNNRETDYIFNETTIMASLSYLGPFVLIPFLTKRNNPFIVFHVKQGLVLFALEVAIVILNMMTFYILTPITLLLNVGLIILSVIGILNVLKMKMTEIPLVGKFGKKIDI